MFIVWTSMLLHAFVRLGGRAWVEQLWIATAAFGPLTVLNALTTDKHLGVTLPAGVWDLTGFATLALSMRKHHHTSGLGNTSATDCERRSTGSSESVH